MEPEAKAPHQKRTQRAAHRAAGSTSSPEPGSHSALDCSVSREKLSNFVLAYQKSLSRVGGARYLAAVREAVEAIASRSHTSLDGDLLDWAKAAFLPGNTAMAAYTAGQVPTAVLTILGQLKKVPALQQHVPQPRAAPRKVKSRAAPQEAGLCETGGVQSVRKRQHRLEEVCISCDQVLPMGEHEEHPMVEGGVCGSCKEKLLDTLFGTSPDGSSAYCLICGGGDDLFVCDNDACARCLCSQCLRRLVGDNEPDEVAKCSPWRCNLCCGRSAGLLLPRDDWNARVLQFFQPEHQSTLPLPKPVPPNQRRGVRVLSLFDGIATGKFVLDQLGISVEAYFASEVDRDAIHVGITQHRSSITYLGCVKKLDASKIQELCPIDLLIGGSPCNDISLVNPDRKGLYDPAGTGILFFEFHRVLYLVRRFNGDRHLFWMFENVAAMPRELRRTISHFLQSEPAVLDGRFFSPQVRARFFWGNVPGMHASLNPDQLQQSASLDSIVDPLLNRTAMVTKIRTVTTNPNSLRPTKNGILPISMNGRPDVLWTTELEEVFGFPRHYTDVGNISLGRRRQLLGKSWSVPVVCHILRPLRSFFKLVST